MKQSQLYLLFIACLLLSLGVFYGGYMASDGLRAPQQYPDGFVYRLDDKGHAIEKHIGKSDKYLKRRLDTEDIYAASTFETMEEAEDAIRLVLEKRKDAIERWLRVGQSGQNAFHAKTGYPVGRVMFRNDDKGQKGTGVRIVLFRDPVYPHGYGILTAYPEK